MTRLTYIILLLVIASSCYRNPPEITFDMTKVLPQDTMVVLFTELQLIEGAVNLKTKEDKPASEYINAFTQQLLDRHGIDTLVLSESIRYYSFHVEKMDEIYEQVIINLARMESEVNKAP